MRHGGDKTTLNRARQLRRNLTKPERLLWAALRRKQRGLRFRQQHPAGPYILDFYCPLASLCVEVDGSHHDQTVAADEVRDQWLAKHGIRVFRVAATDVLADPDAVADWIALQAPSVGCADTSPKTGGGAVTP